MSHPRKSRQSLQEQLQNAKHAGGFASKFGTESCVFLKRCVCVKMCFLGVILERQEWESAP